LAASLRNVGQVLELAGCDKLTLSPELIKELESSEFVVEDKVEIEEKPRQENKITQKKFRWLLNQDPLATEKLSEGIRVFSDDTAALHIFLRKYIKKLKKTVN
jgi:transaldolase